MFLRNLVLLTALWMWSADSEVTENVNGNIYYNYINILLSTTYMVLRIRNFKLPKHF